MPNGKIPIVAHLVATTFTDFDKGITYQEADQVIVNGVEVAL